MENSVNGGEDVTGNILLIDCWCHVAICYEKKVQIEISIILNCSATYSIFSSSLSVSFVVKKHIIGFDRKIQTEIQQKEMIND